MSEDPSTLSAIKCVIVGDGAVGKFGIMCYLFSIYIKNMQHYIYNNNNVIT